MSRARSNADAYKMKPGANKAPALFCATKQKMQGHFVAPAPLRALRCFFGRCCHLASSLLGRGLFWLAGGMHLRVHQRAFRSPFGNLRVSPSYTAGLRGSLLKYRIVVQRHHAIQTCFHAFEAMRVVALTDKPVLLRATLTALPAGFLATQRNSLSCLSRNKEVLLFDR